MGQADEPAGSRDGDGVVVRLAEVYVAGSPEMRAELLRQRFAEMQQVVEPFKAVAPSYGELVQRVFGPGVVDTPEYHGRVDALEALDVLRRADRYLSVGALDLVGHSAPGPQDTLAVTQPRGHATSWPSAAWYDAACRVGGT